MADSEQQQVTSKTPDTKQKNPKRVAAGKAVAERTRTAREKQKKELEELQAKQAEEKPSAEPSAEPPAVTTKNVLTTTQWLSIISIIVSLAGIYYKREEIKNVLTKKATPAPPPSPVLPRAPPSKIRQMD